LKNKKISFIIGIMVCIIIWNLNIAELQVEGQRNLALSLMTVIFWATKITHPGYVAGFYLISLILFRVASAPDILSPWTSSTIYLIIGAYLIASAVENSGLGQRIAYKFIIKFGNSYKSLVLSIFGLTFILSLFIPHPWPRAFIIMSVIQAVVKRGDFSKEDKAKLGFSVFVASVPVSMIFLTGDSIINILAIEFSGQNLSWLGWLYYMGIPSMIASVLTYFLFLKLFKIKGEFNINKKEVKVRINKLGQINQIEKRTIFWMGVAIILWMTDSLHGIELGWVTFLISMLMSMPIIGGVLEFRDWRKVPIEILIFLTAAIGIGNIGNITGMNSWFVNQLLPSSIPDNILIYTLLVTTISIFLHMILGSVVAVMGIAIPTFLTFTASNLALNPLVPTFIVYTSIAMHYILPFHHLNILVGIGENNGLYNEKQVKRMGIPLTFVTYIIVFFQLIWWNITGLI